MARVDAVTSASLNLDKFMDVAGSGAAAPGAASSAQVSPGTDNNMQGRPIEHYSRMLGEADPEAISLKCGVPYDAAHQRLTVALLGRDIHVKWPSGEVVYANTLMPVYPSIRILSLRLVLEGKLVPASGNFLAYAEIPWGPTYLRQFTGKCINRLARMFPDADAFAEACEGIGGKPFAGKADAQYEFEFLPGLFVRALFWEGDDEFEPQAQLLFSDNMPMAFSAEDVSQLSSILLNVLQVQHI